jgi:hypothetical protein
MQSRFEIRKKGSGKNNGLEPTICCLDKNAL